MVNFTHSRTLSRTMRKNRLKIITQTQKNPSHSLQKEATLLDPEKS